MTLTTTLKFVFNSSISLFKLIPFDFQFKKQKWFLYLNNAVFLPVIFLGQTLNPSNQPILIMFFTKSLNPSTCNNIRLSMFGSNKIYNFFYLNFIG